MKIIRLENNRCVTFALRNVRKWKHEIDKVRVLISNTGIVTHSKTNIIQHILHRCEGMDRGCCAAEYPDTVWSDEFGRNKTED